MANSVVKLTIDSQEYDAKLKQAGKALNEYFDICKKGDRTFEVLDKDVIDAVQAMGKMETSCKTAGGQLRELQNSFRDMSLIYRRFTDEEKASPVGKAMAQSLSELKTRIQDTKKDLAAINQELSGSKFGQFGGVIDTIGHKMGLTANATELLTSKTALMYAGIGAGIAIIGKATDAWVKYNSELAKQDQITTVTTGLKGTEADHMTDTMRALADTYKVDFREAINAANTLMSQFGVSGDEAIRLIKDGMQGMIMGDGPKMLQMIKQYAPAFRDAGVSASQLVAVIHNSEGGIFTDQNMNAIVMGMKNIRLMTKQTSDALAQLGIDGRKMSQDLNAGTITVFDALKQVAGELKNVDSNSHAAGEVMQAVFGRQGVTAGTNIAKAIETLNTNLEETKKQTGELGDAFAELQTANEKLNTAIRDCFEYDGWEQMATGIRATLISALADVINLLDGIGATWDDLMKKMGLKNSSKAGAGIGGGLMKNLPETVTQPAEKVNELRKSTNKQATYDKQVSQYDARIVEQKKRVERLESADEAYKSTHPEWQNIVNEEKKTLADLQRMRASYMKQGQEVLNEKPQNINTNNNGGGSGIGSGKKSPQQQAQAKFDQAVKDYNQALEQASLELNAKKIDIADARKKERDAAEGLWKSIGDAREIYDSDELKTAQEEAAKKVVELGGSVKQLETEQKKAQDAARELASAQKKAAEAYRKMEQNQANNDLKSYNTALKQYQTAQTDIQRIRTENPNIPTPQGGKIVYTVEVNDEQLAKLKAIPTDDKTIKFNVVPGSVELPDIPKEVEQIVSTKVGQVLTPDIATEVVQTISTQLGTIVTPEIKEQLTQTINTKVGEVITPEIADTITQVVNVVPGKVELPDVPMEDKTIRFNVEQGNVDLPEFPDKNYTVTIEASTQEAAATIDSFVQDMDAKKIVMPVDAEIPEQPVEVPVKMSYTDNNMAGFLASLKEKIAQEDVGGELYKNLQAQFADANAIANLMQTAIKNGMDISQFDPQGLWGKVFGKNPGDYIEDSELQSIVDKINAYFEENGIKPIKINFNTGNLEEEAEANKDAWKSAASSVSQLGSALQGLEDPAAKIAGIVGQAIANIALTFSKSLAGTIGPWDWIAAAAAGTATMISTITAIKTATSGYEQGGIIKGNSYSGDKIGGMVDGSQLVGLDAGELVLTRAMQGNIASQLEGGNGGGYNMSSMPYTTGEKIVLGINNWGKKTGKGELVFSR